MSKHKFHLHKFNIKANMCKFMIIFGAFSLQCMTNVEEIIGEQAQNVSFQSEVQPIFQQYCISCHGNIAGINLENYEN